MATQTYDESLNRLLVHEGGYTNHPSDPGGPTNFGITIYDYRKYVKPDATAADVRAMRLDEAKVIYRAKYWAAQRCDELPAGVDYAIFDYGVNSGIGRSGKVLRRCLKLPDNTSVVSDAVIAAARAVNPRQLISDICSERLRFLQQLKTWSVFGKGWGARVVEVRAAAIHMADIAAQATATPAPQPAGPVPGKGQVLVSDTAQKGSAGAVAAAGAAAAQQAHQNGIRPLVIVAIVAVAIAVAVGAWMFWHWRQNQQQEKPA